MNELKQDLAAAYSRFVDGICELAKSSKPVQNTEDDPSSYILRIERLLDEGHTLTVRKIQTLVGTTEGRVYLSRLKKKKNAKGERYPLKSKWTDGRKYKIYWKGKV